jgi:hypothetical protein
MYLGSRARHNDRLAETSSLATESLLDAGIWIEVLKATFSRVRPNNPGAGGFFQYGAAHAASFPSGHAMGAFAVATVFAEQYRDRKWMPWLAYGTAGLIAFSRIALGRHFPTGVLVGVSWEQHRRGRVDRQRGRLDRAQRWLGGLT